MAAEKIDPIIAYYWGTADAYGKRVLTTLRDAFQKRHYTVEDRVVLTYMSREIFGNCLIGHPEHDFLNLMKLIEVDMKIVTKQCHDDFETINHLPSELCRFLPLHEEAVELLAHECFKDVERDNRNRSRTQSCIKRMVEARDHWYNWVKRLLRREGQVGKVPPFEYKGCGESWKRTYMLLYPLYDEYINKLKMHYDIA